MNSKDSPVEIRKAALADAEIIAAITDAAYRKYIARMGRKPRPMTADYHQMVAEYPVWLLCLEDQPVGVLVLMAEPETMLIYSVAMHPDYQRRGLGRRLLDLAEAEAQQAGYTRIRLYTSEYMVENIELYRRLGYEETGREQFSGSALVHMAKGLEGNLGR